MALLSAVPAAASFAARCACLKAFFSAFFSLALGCLAAASVDGPVEGELSDGALAGDAVNGDELA